MVLFEIELDIIYPVGSIYFSVNSTNPSELFGGEWDRIKDKFLLCCGDIYENGREDGEASHSLTQSEMPRHTHIQNTHSHGMAHTHNHRHRETGKFSDGSGSDGGYTYSSNRKVIDHHTSYDNTASSKSATDGTTATNKYAGGADSSESASNGSAHNNMPPYLAVYAWVRTG